MKFHLREALLCLSVIAGGCSSEASNQTMDVAMDQETKQALHEIANARVFFGHHSVGENVMAGLKDLAQEAGADIRFVKLGSEEIPSDGPVFVHSTPGKNGKPKVKMDEFFADLSGKGDELNADVALMKICYVDIGPETDTAELAEYYKSQADEAETKLGNTKLLHVTSPLHSIPNDLTAQLKAFAGKGKKVWAQESNMKRQAYNDKIKDMFSDDQIFDLALAESTGPDGQRSLHGEGGQSYSSLWPSYTKDGGHLNDLGRRVVAKSFAISIASALRAN